MTGDFLDTWVFLLDLGEASISLVEWQNTGNVDIPNVCFTVEISDQGIQRHLTQQDIILSHVGNDIGQIFEVDVECDYFDPFRQGSLDGLSHRLWSSVTQKDCIHSKTDRTIYGISLGFV